MEDLINNEVEKLVDVLKEKEGEPIGLNLQMNISIVNALWTILVGEQLSLKDEKLHQIVQTLDDFIRFDDSPNHLLIQMGPFIAQTFSQHYKMARRWVSKVQTLVWPYVKQHQAESGAGSDQNDYIGAYLAAIRGSTDAQSSFHGLRGEHSLVSSLVDLFAAGTETTSSTLLWGLLYLLHHPEVQDKIHQEVDRDATTIERLLLQKFSFFFWIQKFSKIAILFKIITSSSVVL